MSSGKRRNPIAFLPLPVTIITALVYVGLLVGILYVHIVVPTFSKSSNQARGIDVEDAWRDLQEVSNGHHPYNSRRNDEVRDWLLRRINGILERNNAGEPAVYVFNDMTSNLTTSSAGLPGTSGRSQEPGTSVYFEGTNIMVYIRGSEDDESEWWAEEDGVPNGKGGVMVNAHYDSVSTGFGATDDGVGVVSIIQLIQFFTTSGNQPKKGVVALFNNGEEDFLNGAQAFGRHPISKLPHTFLNLEGAAAGGRATLFRSTDTEVTKYYGRSDHPFGSVISADGFNRGLIRSQTDYVVLNGIFGMRGLDVAFLKDRSKYHTDQDDARHTSKDSLWHMLEASLATMKGLCSDTSSQFEGDEHPPGQVASGSGTDPVYFDLFGKAMAVFQLHTLFALSVTLLVVGPIALIAVMIALARVDKMYMFSGSKTVEDGDPVHIHGIRGIFRFPMILILPSAIVVALAYLLAKVNPFIVHSSDWAVWSMMLSAWIFAAWFLSRSADFVQPTALHRVYAFLWMSFLGWLLLIVDTIGENRMHIAGGYIFVFYFAAIFLATLISLLELFALPRKSEYASVVTPRRGSMSSSQMLAPSADERPESHHDDEQPEDTNERTSLLRGNGRRTFANYGRTDEDHETEEVDDIKGVYVFEHEQAWSWALPSWTWLLQFILLAPIVIILVGQLGLLITSALHQTGTDGSSVLMIYIFIAVFSILLLIPLIPFLHRYTYHIPTFLLLVFIGTLVYNLTAFPFSPNNRLKLFFQQTVDLDTGINEASLTGIRHSTYLREAVASLPSTAGQEIQCSEDTRASAKAGLTKCTWRGIAPATVPVKHISPFLPPEKLYGSWLSFNATRHLNATTASLFLTGTNTRACKLLFNRPITDFSVEGGVDDERFTKVPEAGSRELRLWSRTWDRTWKFNVTWEDEIGEGKGLDGRVVCLWSDANEQGVIPAFDEIKRFAPTWVAVTKLGDGLVEGGKAFML